MQTTLSIDDDVLEVVEERARREQTTVGKVLSDLARAAIANPAAHDGLTLRHGFPVLPHRGAVVTSEIVNRIREEEGI